MAAVNLQMMAAMPFDTFLHNPHHPHSRSNSVSSSSSLSPSSRPQSSQGVPYLRNPPAMPNAQDDFYRASFTPPTAQHDLNHHRRPSEPSLWYADLHTPGDSPPNHNLGNPALKSHFRQTHIRARVAASPYPRDTESVHSSSSETEDIAMYLGPAPADYTMYATPQMLGANPDVNPTGAFGRMTLTSDHALEKLAANVRAATTTSASDRAKQIFVQAWYVPRASHVLLSNL